MLAAGTSVVSVPPGMHKPEDDEWLELVQYFGVEVDTSNAISRYLTWLTCYALASAEDLQAATTAVAHRTGITEKEVSASVEAFRNRAQRRAAGDVPAKDS
jgi:hypothetical protein